MEILRFKNSIYVLGNQAADLDSTVCAFSLAALLDVCNPGLKVIPLIQGRKEDLRLKPEIVALFERAGIVPGEENFLDGQSPLTEDAKVILVDHNRADYPGLESLIAGIVDHHRDEGFFKELPLRIIRKTGSCATLITEIWLESGIPIPLNYRLLLLAAVAVDTGSLDPVWGKTTREDRKIYESLSDSLSREEHDFIQSLTVRKLDLSHLSQEDHLRRDFKKLQVSGIRAGISSVPMTVEQFFAPEFYSDDTCESFMNMYCPDLLIIMHSASNPFRRQLSFLCRKKDREESAVSPSLILETLKTLQGFTPLPSPVSDWHSFNQRDPKISRKVLSPRLKEELEKYKCPSLSPIEIEELKRGKS